MHHRLFPEWCSKTRPINSFVAAPSTIHEQIEPTFLIFDLAENSLNSDIIRMFASDSDTAAAALGDYLGSRVDRAGQSFGGLAVNASASDIDCRSRVAENQCNAFAE